MVKTSKSLVASRALTYAGTNGRKYITIHETANTDPGTGAETHARLQQNGFSASWHWSVDDKEAIQSFPHAVRCWHAGDGNAANGGNFNSIGIEICVNSDGDFTKAVKNAAELVKKIMKDEGISSGNVVQHNHWSGKHCPTNLRDGSKGVTWGQFKNMIGGSGGKTTYTPPKKQTGSTTTTKWTKKSGNWTGQVLKQGQYGKPVKQLQTKLANKYFYPNKGAKNNGIDSYFGADTKDAVQRFQSMNGLTVDGVAGKDTYAKLGGKTANKPSGKSIATMVKEVVAGKHGSGHENRRKSLGISKSQYEKVRAEVNKQASGGSSKSSGKSVSQMATEVIRGDHGSGHANRRKSLGISQTQYNKVRAEVNKRL